MIFAFFAVLVVGEIYFVQQSFGLVAAFFCCGTPELSLFACNYGVFDGGVLLVA